MKALKPVEARKLLSAWFPLAEFESGFPALPITGAESLEAPLPVDSGRKVALSRFAIGLFRSDSEILLWLRNWEVFPSSAHLPLMGRLRQALGESRDLSDTPAMCFGLGERDDAISILAASSLFYWDCLVVGADSRSSFFVSHDEFYSLASNESGFLRAAQADLEKAGWA